MDEQLEFKDIILFIKRRSKIFFVAFFIIFLTGTTVAVVLPPIFLSKATILIKEQQIPEGYIPSTDTSYVEERIEVISQKVLSRSQLFNIIEEFGLYADLKDKFTTTELIDKMRQSVILENVNADVVNRRSGKSIESAVAFTLAFESSEPGTAQKVTDRLSNLYVEEEFKNKEKRTSATKVFFQDELNNVKKQIQQYEKKISTFKKAHTGELPENMQMNFQAVSRLERDHDSKKFRLQSLEEDMIYLEGKLATVEPLSPIVIDGEKISGNPREKLKKLYLQLTSLQSTLSDKHPDIRKLKKEITDLEAQVGKSEAATLKIKRLNQIKIQMASLQGELSPKHPDIVKLKNEIGMLEREIGNLSTTEAAKLYTQENPDNPTYIALTTKISATKSEIASYRQEIINITEQIKNYRSKIENTPSVEKEYNELTRDYENAKRKYNEIYNKFLEAKVAEKVETTDSGGRFIIKSPAYLPEKPYKPNRIAIILISFIISIGTSFCIIAIRESMDQSVKTPTEINKLTNIPVMSIISYIETDKDKRAKWNKRIIWASAAASIIAIALVLINYYVISLDSIWTNITNIL